MINQIPKEVSKKAKEPPVFGGPQKNVLLQLLELGPDVSGKEDRAAESQHGNQPVKVEFEKEFEPFNLTLDRLHSRTSNAGFSLPC